MDTFTAFVTLREEYLHVYACFRAAEKGVRTANGEEKEWFLSNIHRLRASLSMLRADADSFVRLPVQSENCRCSRLFSRLRTVMLHAQETAGLAAQVQALAPALTEEELLVFDRVYILALIAVICEAARSGTGAEKMPLWVHALTQTEQIPFARLYTEYSAVEKCFRKDPDGYYMLCDESSKALYRRQLLRAAYSKGISAAQLAQKYLRAAQHGTTVRNRHIGKYLFQNPYPKRRLFYFSTFLLFMLIYEAVLGVLCYYAKCSLLLFGTVLILSLFPGYKLVAFFCDRIFSRAFASDAVLSLNYRQIPQQARTLVVIPTLFSDRQAVDLAFDHLADFFLRNQDEQIRFCVLADFPEGKQEHAPGDLALLQYAKQRLQLLLKNYADRFFLLVRRRVLLPNDGIYMGWERKRGALVELMRLLHTNGVQKGSFFCMEGAEDALKDIRYVLTLDGDTLLPYDCVRNMVNIMLHPLHLPVYNKAGNAVVHGFGVLQPGIVCDPESAEKTLFSKLVSAGGGMPNYACASFQTAMHVYGCGVFCGKGMLDVQAYIACTADAFPENAVLSHDMLEGARLRCLYVPQLSLMDTTPATPQSFLKRRERWDRGDVQALLFACPTHKNAAGKRVRCPVPLAMRFCQFENVFRMLYPLCLLGGIFLYAYTAVSLPILLCFSFALLLQRLLEIYNSMKQTAAMREMLTPIRRSVLLFFLAWISLARSAGVSLAALIRALWRMFVSKRRLLAWVTAAQGERERSFGFISFLCAYGFSFVCGILLCLSFSPFAVAMGVLFCSVPIFEHLLAQSIPHEPLPLSVTQRREIDMYAARAWRYFEKTVGEQSAWLPPDNLQQIPRGRLAMRTSPTNIGMYAMSVLAARDFSLIASAELYHRLQAMCKTIELLPKWQGNLYNWYDLNTLRILGEPFVSSVDSGNFVAAMICVGEGVLEYAQEYPQLRQVSARLLAIARACSLKPFYNSKKKLFAIGYYPSKKQQTENVYDLYLSEARILSYLAVARGCVPATHWNALSRIAQKRGSFAGLYSWSGTAFEAFMPYLWLEAPCGTLEEEALAFSESLQHSFANQVDEKHCIFGVSESAYFAFDAEMNYQYRAFGVPRAALDIHAAQNRVYAPYASFLMLPFSRNKNSILDNLRNFSALGADSSIGFSEAVDCTSARVGGGYAIVHCYMAHHVGMSLCALANTAFAGIFQRRFLRDTQMHAASILMRQELPRYITPFTPYSYAQPLPKSTRALGSSAQPVHSANHAGLLSDTVNRMYCSDAAEVTLMHGESCICHADFAIDFQIGTHYYRLLGPHTKTDACKWEWRENTLRVERKIFCGTLTLECCYIQGGVFRVICGIKEQQKIPKPCRVLLSMTPVLQPLREYEGHPSFSKLFLECVTDAENGLMLLHRRKRGSNGKETFVGIAVSTRVLGFIKTRLPFSENTPFFQSVLEHCRLCQDGGMIEPFAAVLAELEEEGTIFSVTMQPTVALARQQALYTEQPNQPIRLWQELQVWNDDAVLDALQALYSRSRRFAPAHFHIRSGIDALWKNGISGDIPLLYLDARATDAVQQNLLYHVFLLFRTLKLCGEPCELCIGYAEKDHYVRSEEKRLTEVLRQCGLSLLQGGRGGIHLICAAENESLLHCMPYLADWVCQQDNSNSPAPPISSLRFVRAVQSAVSIPTQGVQPVYGGAFDHERGAFWIQKGVQNRPWSYLLASPAFGTLLTQDSLGYTWVQNAQKYRLSPWFDSVGRGGEALYLSFPDGQAYDLCACSSAVCLERERVLYRGVCRDVSYVLCVTIARNAHGKYYQVCLETPHPVKLEVALRLEPLLCESRLDRSVLSVTETERGFLFENLFCGEDSIRKGGVFLQTDGAHSCFTAGGALYCVWRGDGAHARVNFALVCYATTRELQYLLSAPQRGQEAVGEDKLSCDITGWSTFVDTFLPRQILRSRLYGRTGYDQSGGAYGFRDQLQDTLGFLTDHPTLARTQLLRCAACQFIQGDVLHWWYSDRVAGRQVVRGIRTRCSDDYLWLVFCLCAYLQTTHDTSVLSIRVRYLHGEVLQEGETEHFGSFAPDTVAESLYMHAVRALEHAFSFGEHGLCLFGSCDWNDGMNEVGIKGSGESVWLTMFLALCLRLFLPICRQSGDLLGEEKYRGMLRKVEQHLRENSWAGHWFLRGFYDDGSPLGKQGADACAIDILPQAFAAVLQSQSQGTVFPQEWCKEALDAMREKLLVPEAHIMRLFTPPFDRSIQSPGYVAGYVPGVRENGGQYTHAAMFAVWGLFEAGRDREATELLFALTPAIFCQDSNAAKQYGGEPYALAGDVYDAPGFQGRAGWTQYTGSAAWYRKLVYEYLFGIVPRAGKLYLRPRLTDLFAAYTLQTSVLGTRYEITARKTGNTRLLLDGTEYTPDTPLPLDGRPHTVWMTI